MALNRFEQRNIESPSRLKRAAAYTSLYFTDNDVPRKRDKVLLRGAHAMLGLAGLGMAGVIGYSATHGGYESIPLALGTAVEVGIFAVPIAELARATFIKAAAFPPGPLDLI